MRGRAILPIAAVVLLGAVPLVILGRLLNMDVDETYTLHTTAGSLPDALQRALHFEFQPPLYFVALDLWRHISSNPDFARFFSTLCVLAAATVTGTIGVRFFGTLWGALLAMAVLLNPLAFWAALEIRPYGFIMLLAALLVWLFLEGFALGDARWARGAYIAVAIAALYTQYYLGFLLAANAVALVLFARGEPLRRYAIDMIPVAIAFAPMLLVLPSQLSASATSFQATGSPLFDLRFDIRRLILTVFPLGDPPVSALIVASGLLVVLGAVAVFRHRPADQAQPALAPIIWCSTFVAAAIFVLVQIGAREPDNPRYFSLFVPPAMVALYAALQSGRAWRDRFVAVAAAFALLIASAITLAQTYSPLAKFGDWRRVATFLAPRVAQGEPVLVFEAENALPLSYYYPGKLIPVPRAISLQAYDPRTLVLQNESDLSSALASAHPSTATAWLVTGDYCGWPGLDFRCSVLESWVRHHFEVTQTVHFFGSTVRLLRRTSAIGEMVGAR